MRARFARERPSRPLPPRAGREIDVKWASFSLHADRVAPAKLGERSTGVELGGCRLRFVRTCASGDADHDRCWSRSRARGRGDQRAHRCVRDRPHRRRRAPSHRGRPPPGFRRAGTRRHHPAHGRARARGQHQLGGVRARQFRRRADRAPDRRAALSHGRIGRVLARSRPSRVSPTSPRAASDPIARTARPPTSFASRSIPAAS